MNIPFLHFLFLGLPLLGFSSFKSSPSAVLQQDVADSPAPTGVPDQRRMVARVGRVEITEQDLNAEYERLIPRNFFHGKVPEEKKLELRVQARDALIEKALIFQDAQDLPILVGDESIRERLVETLGKAGPRYAKVSDEEFEALLREYRPAVLRRILIERNEERFDKSLKPIAEEALKARFEELKDELFTPESASFLMIQVDVDPAMRPSLLPIAHLKAKEIRAEFEGGAAFGDLAKKYSDAPSAASGGALGFVTRRSFPVPELRDPVFALADGETSQPIESIYGVHLVQRLATQPRQPLGYQAARPQLLAELEHVQRSHQRKTWLDGLRKRYPVEILVTLPE